MKRNDIKKFINDEKIPEEARKIGKSFLGYWYTIKEYPKLSFIGIIIFSLWYFKDSIYSEAKSYIDSNNSITRIEVEKTKDIESKVSNTFTYFGTIKDQDGNEVSDVDIKLENTGRLLASSNGNGFFKFTDDKKDIVVYYEKNGHISDNENNKFLNSGENYVQISF